MALLTASINWFIAKGLFINKKAPMEMASSLTLASALINIIFTLLSICNLFFNAQIILKKVLIVKD